VNRVGIQSIEKIASKYSSFDHCTQVGISGGNETNVGANRDISSDSFKLLILQDTQNFRLRQRSHGADFVEEQCAAVALFKLADPLSFRSRQRSLLVTEQFAFKQVLRDSRAMNGQERTIGPLAILTDRAGNDFFASAAFAKNQHGDVLSCHRCCVPNPCVRRRETVEHLQTCQLDRIRHQSGVREIQ
jgi:hypothetical protein